MNLEKLDQVWRAKYSDCEPIAHNLKHAYAEYWVRIHTLEDRKRYAENDQEAELIIERQISLLRLLGVKNEKLLVLTCGWSGTSAPTPSEASKISPRETQYWKSILQNPEETDPAFISYVHLYIHEASLEEMTNLFAAVANDEIGSVIVMPSDLEWLYHPYDGGTDIIARSETTRRKIKKQFSNLLA